MTRTETINYELECRRVLEEINNEYFKQQAEVTEPLKKEMIWKAVESLQALGLSNALICTELGGRDLKRGLRFASSSYIRKVLTREFKDAIRDTSSANDDNNSIEQDAKNVREIHDITEGEEPEEEGRYYDLKQKIKILKEENKDLYDQYIHFKTFVEVALKTGTMEGMNLQVAIHAEHYDQIRSLMNRSPKGILLIHDVYNAVDFKPLKASKPKAIEQQTTNKEIEA